jgi:hypothetical protein
MQALQSLQSLNLLKSYSRGCAAMDTYVPDAQCRVALPESFGATIGVGRLISR